MNRKGLMRKMAWPVSVLMVILTAFSSVGCSTSGKDNKKVESTAAATKNTIPSDKNFNIKIMDWQGQNPAYWNAREAVFKDYMTIHPNVKIEHIYQPNWQGGYEKLLDTQFVAHKAPDIIEMGGAMALKYTNQSYLLGLDAYFQAPNPYDNGGETWVDTIRGGIDSFTMMKSGNNLGIIYAVPVDGTGYTTYVPFYYNKDILKKANVTDIPKTWTEFIAACKKIKDAGFTPVAADNNRFLNWTLSFFSAQMGENYLSQYVDNKFLNPNLNREILYSAYLNGKIKADEPASLDQLKILKDFSQYWQNGWAGANEQQAQQLFMYGTAAFLQDGNWNMGYYKNNLNGIDWGVMPYPLLTKNESKYAEGAWPKAVSNNTGGLTVNKDVEQDADKLKVVLDILQFFTSAKENTVYAAKAPTIPVNKAVNVPDEMKSFMAPENISTLKFPIKDMILLSPGIWTGNSNVWPMTQEYLQGKISLEDFTKKVHDDNLPGIKKYAVQQLDEKVGVPSQIAAMQKKVDDAKAQKASQAVIDSLQSSLDSAKLKLELWKSVEAYIK